MDHVRFLCDVAELNWVFSDSTSIESFLQKIVSMVARHMQAKVCSIYLFDEHNAELVLTATVGLNPSQIGTVRLKIGEGLTGLAVQELRPICENNSSAHPRYKFFEGLNEERFEAFCAAPLLRGIRRIGALVVQREKPRPFSEEDTTVMRALANQLANTIENARLILSVEAGRHELIEQRPVLPPKFLKGKVASPGYALAESMVEQRQESLEQFRQLPARRTVDLAAFEQALRDTEYELEELQKKVEEKLADGASLIFGAHLLLLKDAQFTGEMARLIRTGTDAVAAVIAVADSYMRLFGQKESEYFREKRDDIKDLGRRLLRHLTQQHADSRSWHSRIVIARSLLPSDVLKLALENVAGIVLVSGGVTSHVSIIARSLRIPLFFCDEPALLGVADGTRILLDGEQGNIYLDPDQSVIRTYRVGERARRMSKTARTSLHERTLTSDGTPIRLVSNINLLSDLDAALAMKSEGVGLYRSEFPFMIRSTFPTEEEQFMIYRKLDAKMAGREVVFRTLDIGGDKALSYFHDFKENNPFLGMRSIRFALSKRDIFMEQIRAILRAGAQSRLKIMFPMISSLEEFGQARRMVTEAAAALAKAGISHNANPAIGMMIEIPSVLTLLDAFCEVADFFSIGTNDFIQYMLAVDRTNEKVAPFYLPHHPAVLRGIKQVIDVAGRHGREVSLCGDMAHDERYTAFLIGAGIRTLSIEPVFMPAIQARIEGLQLSKATRLAQSVLAADSIPTIEQLLGIAPAPDRVG